MQLYLEGQQFLQNMPHVLETLQKYPIRSWEEFLLKMQNLLIHNPGKVKTGSNQG